VLMVLTVSNTLSSVLGKKKWNQVS
jgi:hypothetical protein